MMKKTSKSPRNQTGRGTGSHPSGDFPHLSFRNKEVVSNFSGGNITSDGGMISLFDVARITGLLDRFTGCFNDGRAQCMVAHNLTTLISQRVLAMACGYQDLSDHDSLRFDGAFATLAEIKGIDRADCAPIAGKSTMQRLDGALGLDKSTKTHKIRADAAAIDRMLVDYAMSKHAKQPNEIAIDIDMAHTTTHGEQEGTFFNSYYDSFGYHPVFAFWGKDIILAKIRPGNAHSATDVIDMLKQIVRQIRTKWPTVRIRFRGDAGYCTPELINWCDNQGLGFTFGLTKNPRLTAMITDQMARAEAGAKKTGKSAQVFTEFKYAPKKNTWNRQHRAIAKAEYTILNPREGNGEAREGRNPRFVVTNLGSEFGGARQVYKKIYCARGETENRIKEVQLDLFGNLLSNTEILGNQMRLYFSAIAYMLAIEFKRLALTGTELAKAAWDTIRTKYIKIGAKVSESRRRILIALNSASPYKNIYITVMKNLEGRVKQFASDPRSECQGVIQSE